MPLDRLFHVAHGSAAAAGVRSGDTQLARRCERHSAAIEVEVGLHEEQRVRAAACARAARGQSRRAADAMFPRRQRSGLSKMASTVQVEHDERELILPVQGCTVHAREASLSGPCLAMRSRASSKFVARDVILFPSQPSPSLAVGICGRFYIRVDQTTFPCPRAAPTLPHTLMVPMGRSRSSSIGF